MIRRLLRLCPAVLPLALAVCDVRISRGGNQPIARGPYGRYMQRNLAAVLPEGDTVTVYRVTYVRFDNGDPPALQIEYEPPFPTATRCGCGPSRAACGPPSCRTRRARG